MKIATQILAMYTGVDSRASNMFFFFFFRGYFIFNHNSIPFDPPPKRQGSNQASPPLLLSTFVSFCPVCWGQTVKLNMLWLPEDSTVKLHLCSHWWWTRNKEAVPGPFSSASVVPRPMGSSWGLAFAWAMRWNQDLSGARFNQQNMDPGYWSIDTVELKGFFHRPSEHRYADSVCRSLQNLARNTNCPKYNEYNMQNEFSSMFDEVYKSIVI